MNWVYENNVKIRNNNMVYFKRKLLSVMNKVDLLTVWSFIYLSLFEMYITFITKRRYIPFKFMYFSKLNLLSDRS